jgi:hypothetical protein
MAMEQQILAIRMSHKLKRALEIEARKRELTTSSLVRLELQKFLRQNNGNPMEDANEDRDGQAD